MRFPRPQLTIAHLMVAVSIVALLLAIEELRRRRHEFLLEAEKCDAQACVFRAMAEKHMRLVSLLTEDEHVQGAEEKSHVAAYFERRAWNCRNAAARPWLTVRSEPPPP